MHRKQVRACSMVVIATVLLSMGEGIAKLNPQQLAIAAPNPLANPHFSAAMSRMEQKDLPGAMTELNRAIQLEPSLAEAYTLRGVLFMSEKNFQKAAEDFTQVTQLEPKNAEAHTNLAKSQLMLKDYQSALETATTATQLDPKSQYAAILKRLAQSLVDASE